MRIQDQALILQRLKEMSKFTGELAEYLPSSLREYLRDALRRRSVERMTQVVIENAIDINDLLIKALQHPPVGSAAESFDRVRDMKAMV